MSEFKKWLKCNARHLADYSPDEIANLAILAGFGVAEVCQGLSHGFMDIATHSTYALREDWFVDRELRSITPTLSDQWYFLMRHQEFGEDFDANT